MSIKNIQIDGEKLLATKAGAQAVSEVILQDDGDNDFESVRETRSIMLLQNICDTSLSTADKAVLTEDVQEGDRIFIEHNGVIYDTVATGVLSADQGLVPTMTSNTEPAGEVILSPNSNVTTDAYKLFNPGTHTNVYNGKGFAEITYKFDNDEPIEIKKANIKIYAEYASNSVGGDTEVKISGSLDGINFITLSTLQYHFSSSNSTISKIQNILLSGAYIYYKVTVKQGGYTGLEQIQFYTTGGNSINTLGITHGAVPTRVFKYTDSIKYNDTICTEKDVYTEFGTQGSKLYVQSLYNDALISGRELKTTINFSATSNELLELSGQVFKAV